MPEKIAKKAIDNINAVRLRFCGRGFIVGQDLDKQFLQLLNRIAKHENTTIEKVGKTLAPKEIENRTTFYPQLEQVLSRPELDIDEFKGVVKNCWAATTRYESIRFGRFTKEEQAAILAIQTLINDFPQDDAEAAARIDSFINEAIRLGYTRKADGPPDRPGAAALCSVILTSLFPGRFVDYKPERWRIFAHEVDYVIPFPGTGSYGRGIVWAGKFAAELVQTSSFRQRWDVKYPLWVVAGIAWVLPDKLNPNKDASPMPDTKEDAEITSLLKHKKQVILYGPPGTGKTYRANNYISHFNAHGYEVHEDSLLDQRVFSLTIYEPRDGQIPDLTPGTRFMYTGKEGETGKRTMTSSRKAI